MKSKYLVLFAGVLVLLMTAGCKKKAEAPKNTDPLAPQMTMSAFDTTTVQQLTYEFLDLLKEEKYEDAISRLYVLDGDQVKPLPAEQKAECLFSLSLHKVYGYQITDYTFFKETDSEVRCEMYIEDPTSKSDPARLVRLFRPVRRDGAWYLTLANSQTETQRSQIDSLRQLQNQSN